MSATAADVNGAMKNVLKTLEHAFADSNPPQHGMSRTLLNEAVVNDLIKKKKIKPDDASAATCVRGVVGNLIFRYIRKLDADQTAAIRQVDLDNSYWLNLDQEGDDADTDGLRVCGS